MDRLDGTSTKRARKAMADGPRTPHAAWHPRHHAVSKPRIMMTRGPARTTPRASTQGPAYAPRRIPRTRRRLPIRYFERPTARPLGAAVPRRQRARAGPPAQPSGRIGTVRRERYRIPPSRRGRAARDPFHRRATSRPARPRHARSLANGVCRHIDPARMAFQYRSPTSGGERRDTASRRSRSCRTASNAMCASHTRPSPTPTWPITQCARRHRLLALPRLRYPAATAAMWPRRRGQQFSGT